MLALDMATTDEALRGLDLAALGALLEVIHCGSFTAASKGLGISQPAVSLAIKRLEERLGSALLIRTRKGITPSRPGETLANGARLAFEALAEALAQIADEQVEPSGRVVLGCHESLAAYALPRFMAGFLPRYPKIDLTLWNGGSMEVEAEIIAGRIELALVVNPSQHPETVVVPLFEDSVELFHCLPARSTVDATELLASLPLIYVPELVQSQNILRELQKQGIVASRPLPCSSLALVKNLVIDKVGVGILPRRVAAHNTTRKLHSLSPPMPLYEDHVALVRRFDLPRTAATRLVMDELRAHGKEMA